MFNDSGLKDDLRSKTWAECAMTTTYLSNVIAIKSGNKFPYELLFRLKAKLHSCLKTFGITTKDEIQGKLRNRGSTFMFVGYTDNHSRDLFRMNLVE
jgi:hypothetical protein